MVYNPRLGTTEKSEFSPSVSSDISVIGHSSTPEAEAEGL